MAAMNPQPVTLSPTQARILREAAANGGLLHIGEWMKPKERKAADGLVRMGVLSPGSGLRGVSARHITGHGRRVLADLDAKEQ
ncbi:hypothetical protein [Plantactinospora sp. WMMB782]|uniref:hypothetical protein n=1 Tax=Plantactinospora sp. WMMB782 TaxID=3404121 RepID=UPI003B94D818